MVKKQTSPSPAQDGKLDNTKVAADELDDKALKKVSGGGAAAKMFVPGDQH